MMQLIIVTRQKPLCHGLNAFAFTGSDQPSHVKWTHPPPRLVTQTIQERLEPASKLVFPIRRHASMVDPPKADHPWIIEKLIWESPDPSQSAKVVLVSCSNPRHGQTKQDTMSEHVRGASLGRASLDQMKFGLRCDASI